MSRKKYDYKKAQKWGIIGWAVPVLNILMSASSEVGSYQIRQFFSVAGCSDNYVRLEPGLNKAAPEMDDVSEKNIDKLKDADINMFNTGTAHCIIPHFCAFL